MPATALIRTWVEDRLVAQELGDIARSQLVAALRAVLADLDPLRAHLTGQPQIRARHRLAGSGQAARLPRGARRSPRPLVEFGGLQRTLYALRYLGRPARRSGLLGTC